MQVENELGITGDSRDRSPLAEAAWAKPVPNDLMAFLTKNKASLLPELQEVWGRNGYKTSGTWAEVFGDDARADEIFMAYFYAPGREPDHPGGQSRVEHPDVHKCVDIWGDRNAQSGDIS